jgi:hypothetical protein
MIILPGRGFHSRLNGKGFYVVEQEGQLIYLNYQELVHLSEDIQAALDAPDQWVKDKPFEDIR